MATMRLRLEPDAQRSTYWLGTQLRLVMEAVDAADRLLPIDTPQAVVTLADGTTVTYATGWQATGLGGWVLTMLLDVAGTWSIAASCAAPAGLTASASVVVDALTQRTRPLGGKLVCGGANRPAITGTTVGGTSALAGYGSQLGTGLPAGDYAFVEWQSQAAGYVALVFDDGSADPPTSYEVLVLTGAGANGGEGSADRLDGYRGRVRAYGLAGSPLHLKGR